ncbi:MAG: peptidylprolyl isomerase [Candidatus Eisenbacteria bacterium]
MRRNVLAGCIIGVVFISLSCGQTDEKVAARIGDEVITVGMLKEEYLAISRDARPDLITIDEKEQFARDVVSKELLYREAKDVGLDRNPDVVELGKSTLRSAAWQVFYEDRIRSQVDLTDDDLQGIFSRQRYSYHIGWIFVRSGALAGDIRARIEKGEDFSKLASIFSIDATRDQGGDIGTRALGTLPAEVEDMLMMMSAGEVSEPIVYSGFYILVKLFDKQPVEQPDFEAARSGLESLARMRKENMLQKDVADELRAKYNLTFKDDVIDMIVAKTRAIYDSEDDPPGEVPEFSDEDLGRTVATFEGGEWKVRDYAERVKAQHEYFRPAFGTDTEAVTSVITDFITGELWGLEIHTEGYDKDPKAVKAAERAVEERVVTEMHQQLIAGVKVEEDSLLALYETKKADLVSESGADLAVIIVASEDEADQVYDALSTGSGFEDLARENSIDAATAKNGGKIGRTLYQRQLEQFPEIEDLVMTLDTGAYSEPLMVPPGFGPDGYMVLRVLEKIESRPLEFEEVREMLGQTMLQVEQDKAFGGWLREKMDELDVEIYPDALAQIKFVELRGQED